jgi:peptide/nickel transport system ATP-binding protein
MRALLEVRNLGLALPESGTGWGRSVAMRHILQDISFDVAAGAALGLVGESGSGKTSLGRCLVRLLTPTSGTLLFEGRDISHEDEAALRPLRRRFQMIFQDPQSSLNPRRMIGASLAEPYRTFGLATGRAAARAVDALLERVGLTAAMAARYPHHLSGGQRQRVGIARALASGPSLVVADEIVSGLDVSSQAQILALLRE